MHILIFSAVITVVVWDDAISESCFLQLEGGTQPVKNLSCVVHNWSNMTCVWDLQTVCKDGLPGIKQLNLASNDYKVTLEWTTFQVLALCRRMTLNGSCLTFQFLQEDGRDSYRQGAYFFHVNITYLADKVTIQTNTTVQTDQYVQPTKVVDLTAISKATKIKLTWVKDKPWLRVKFRIRYISSWDDPDILENWKTEDIDQNEISIWDIDEDFRFYKHSKRISNLTPNTEYRLQVSSIPLVHREEQGFWSDFVEIKTKTLEDVPGGVPYIRPSFYDCRNSNCSSITLYWQPLEKKKQHGRITNYIVKTNNTSTFTAGNMSSATLLVDSSFRTTINLTQVTKSGPPHVDDASIVLVPSSERPTFQGRSQAVELSPSSVQFHLPSGHSTLNISRFVVVWCIINGDKECVDTIQFKIVGSNTTELTLTLPKENVILYKFGVAVETNDDTGIQISSGIIWIECVYRRSEVPRVPLKAEIVMEKMLASSMRLKWRPYSCKQTRGILKNYILEYCGPSRNCSESRKTIYIQPGTINYTIQGLRPGRYKSWIRGNFSGGVGPKGDAIHFIIYARKERNTGTWWTGIAILLTLSFSVPPGLYLIILARKSMSKKISIKIPRIKTFSEVVLVEVKRIFDRVLQAKVGDAVETSAMSFRLFVHALPYRTNGLEKRPISTENSCTMYNYSSASDKPLTQNIIANPHSYLEQFEKQVLLPKCYKWHTIDHKKDMIEDSEINSYTKQCLGSEISHLSVSTGDEQFDRMSFLDNINVIANSEQTCSGIETTEKIIYKCDEISNENTDMDLESDNSYISASDSMGTLQDLSSSNLPEYFKLDLGNNLCRKPSTTTENSLSCNAETLEKDSKFLFHSGGE